MKKLSFMIAMSFLWFSSSAQIEQLYNIPDDLLFCVSHPEPGIVYLTGEHAVYKSNDNGDSWGPVFTFDTAYPRFFGIWFRDALTGYATGTINSKNFAATVFYANNGYDYQYDFYDNHGYEKPSLPWLFKTVDGGVTWQLIDTTHSFINLQFIGPDTLFALDCSETADKGRLCKSVDGGLSWERLLWEDSLLCDFSVVNGDILYALRGTRYANTADFSSPANPKVYKSSDGGQSWETIRPLDTMDDKIWKIMDQIYFYGDGEGAILGHESVFTDDDFATYDMVWSGFPTVPDGNVLQNSTLRSGFQISSSLDDFHVGGYSVINISRDFGRHRKCVTPDLLVYISNMSGCDADTTFFVVSMGFYGNGNLYRAKGSDFPNVGVPEHPSIPLRVSSDPSSSQYTIHSEIPISHVDVYDIAGRYVEGFLCNGQCDATIQASHWPSGIYLLVVHTEKGVVTTKIVKL